MVSVKNLSDTEVEIRGEINVADLESHRKGVIEKLQERVDLPGFRKGHVPENIIRERVGPIAILEDMAIEAIKSVYPAIIVEHKIAAIDRPEVTLTKIAEGSSLEFVIKQAVIPKVKLPDYKDIAKKAGVEVIEPAESEKDAEGKEVPKPTPEQLEQIKQNKKRERISDAMLENCKFIVPPVMVERQLDAFMDEMSARVESMGMKFDDYIKAMKREKASLRDDLRVEAEKRVRLSLILDTIAMEEKVEIPKEELDKEVGFLIKHNPEVSETDARSYIHGILRTQRVFTLLESV